MAEYQNIPDNVIFKIREGIKKKKEENQGLKYNSLFIHKETYDRDTWDYKIYFTNIGDNSILELERVKTHNKTLIISEDFYLRNIGGDGVSDKSSSYLNFNIRYYLGNISLSREPIRREGRGVGSTLTSGAEIGRPQNWIYNTICFPEPYKTEFIGDTENDPILKDLVDEMKKNFSITPGCNEVPEPTPTPQDTTEGTGTSCSTSGIYGGYGQKLTDIKLFLYANKVTAGTVKLNKPQLEVGTVATDWRPNADEAIKHYTPAYKQVKGLAIKQGNGKTYLEIPTVEGDIYGVDLWGGDTAKLLKDEIAELKEQIKELKNQIK